MADAVQKKRATFPFWAPAKKRERLARKLDRERRKAQGLSTPRLRTILLVELDAIYVPDWAKKKAVPGLTLTRESIWLGRIAGRILEREDRAAGGNPRVTAEVYRPCKCCKRPLLGLAAEERLSLDRRFHGDRIPCSPECAEIQAARTKRKGRANQVFSEAGDKSRSAAQ
jgi:hypothetical protein